MWRIWIALLTLCALTVQRALSVLRTTLIEQSSQALSHDRRSPVQLPDVALEQHDQSHRRGRDDRGGAQTAYRHFRRRGPVGRRDQHGYFAYYITSPDRSHRLTIDDDIGSTALDGVHGIPNASLGSEQLPGRDFHL